MLGTALVLVQLLNVFGLGDPVQVAFQVLLQLLLFTEFLEQSTGVRLFSLFGELAGKDTQHEVQHEEGAKDDQGDKVDPGPFSANCVVYLKIIKIFIFLIFKYF